MKGLLVKDFCLLLQRKRFFIVLLVLAVFMGFSFEPDFVAGYLTILTAVFAVSTVSYDEYDNCYPFLMTLPVSRKLYTGEKYLFGLLLGLCAWAVGIVLCLCIAMYRGETGETGMRITELLIYIPLFLFMIDLALPFQLKYGAERGRMALLMAVGVAVVLFVGAKKLGSHLGLPGIPVTGIAEGLGENGLLAVFFVAAAAVTLISYRISQGIMERKEL